MQETQRREASRTVTIEGANVSSDTFSVIDLCRGCGGGCAERGAIVRAGTGPADGLQEVVVTARYKEENLQTTPLAITALSVEDLEARNLVNVDNLGQSVPNAFFIQPVSNFGPTTTIGLRGINTTDYSYAFEPSVGIYIDDVYQATLTGSSFELMDLDRVEVLRGPQGTLFGKNSLGGAVRLISKKPMGDNTGSVEVTYGAYDRIDAKAVGDFSLVARQGVPACRRRLAPVAMAYGKSLDFTCEMIRRGTPQLAGIGDGLGADGSAGGGLNGLPDNVAVGSAADNAFSFPMSVDPKQGSGCARQKLGGSETQAARAMLRLLPSDRLELNFAADYQAQSDQPFAETLLNKRGPASTRPTTTSCSASTASTTSRTTASSRAARTRTTRRGATS